MPLRHGDRRNRGKPQPRGMYSVYVRRNPREVEEEEKWRENANNMEYWGKTKVTVERSDE